MKRTLPVRSGAVPTRVADERGDRILNPRPVDTTRAGTTGAVSHQRPIARSGDVFGKADPGHRLDPVSFNRAPARGTCQASGTGGWAI